MRRKIKVSKRAPRERDYAERKKKRIGNVIQTTTKYLNNECSQRNKCWPKKTESLTRHTSWILWARANFMHSTTITKTKFHFHVNNDIPFHSTRICDAAWKRFGIQIKQIMKGHPKHYLSLWVKMNICEN